jgi:hypothetical protein
MSAVIGFMIDGVDNWKTVMLSGGAHKQTADRLVKVAKNDKIKGGSAVFTNYLRISYMKGKPKEVMALLLAPENAKTYFTSGVSGNKKMYMAIRAPKEKKMGGPISDFIGKAIFGALGGASEGIATIMDYADLVTRALAAGGKVKDALTGKDDKEWEFWITPDPENKIKNVSESALMFEWPDDVLPFPALAIHIGACFDMPAAKVMKIIEDARG